MFDYVASCRLPDIVLPNDLKLRYIPANVNAYL